MFYIPIHLLYKRQHFLPCVPLSVGLHSEDTQLFCELLGTVEFETRNVILALMTKQQVQYLGHYISTISIHILLFISDEVTFYLWQKCAYILIKEQTDVFSANNSKWGRDNVMYLKFSRSVNNLTWLNPFSQCSIHASKFLNNKAAVALSKCCLSVGWTVENPVSAYSFGRGTSLDAMFWSCDLILINCCIIDFSGAFSRNGDYIIET